MKLSYNSTRDFVLSCLRAGVTPHVVGAPGIGKSAMLGSLAGEMGLTLEILVGSTVGDDDIPGTPYVSPRSGLLEQAHRGPLRAAIEGPVLLALDEWTTVSETAQATSLALILDRRAGDKALHPGTRVVVLSNAPEHAPGAMRFSAATANRLNTVEMQPSTDEIASWFTAQENAYLSEFGVFLRHDPTLVELEPGPQDLECGRTWASPRGCERAVRSFGAFADATKMGLAEGAKTGSVAMALVAGSMGAGAAGRYFAAREQRRHLPPLADILRDPTIGGKLPKEPGPQLAAVSVIPTIRRHDTGAAWVWASELQGRFRGAATACLMAPGAWVPGPFDQIGKRLQVKMIADAVKAK